MNSLYHQDMYNFDIPVSSYWERTKENIEFYRKYIKFKH